MSESELLFSIKNSNSSTSANLKPLMTSKFLEHADLKDIESSLISRKIIIDSDFLMHLEGLGKVENQVTSNVPKASKNNHLGFGMISKVSPEDNLSNDSTNNINKFVQISLQTINSVGSITYISTSTALSLPPELRLELRSHNRNLLQNIDNDFIRNFKENVVKITSLYSNTKFEENKNESAAAASDTNKLISCLLHLFERMFSKGIFNIHDVLFVLDELKKIPSSHFIKNTRTCVKILSHCVLLVNDHEIAKAKKVGNKFKFTNLFIQNNLLCSRLSDIMIHSILSQKIVDSQCQDELQHIIWSTLFYKKDICWRNIKINMGFTSCKLNSLFEKSMQDLKMIIKEHLQNGKSDAKSAIDLLQFIREIDIFDQNELFYSGIITVLVFLLYLYKMNKKNSKIVPEILKTIYHLAKHPIAKRMVVSELLSDCNFVYLKKMINDMSLISQEYYNDKNDDVKNGCNVDILYFLGRIIDTKEAAEIALDHLYFTDFACDALRKSLETYFDEKNYDKYKKYKLIMMLKFIKKIIIYRQTNEEFFNKWQATCFKVQEILCPFIIRQSMSSIHKNILSIDHECVYFTQLDELLKNLKNSASFGVAEGIQKFQKCTSLKQKLDLNHKLIDFALHQSDKDKQKFTSQFASFALDFNSSCNHYAATDLYTAMLQTFNYSVMESCKNSIYQKISTFSKMTRETNLTGISCDKQLLTKWFVELSILHQNFVLQSYEKIVDPIFTDLVHRFDHNTSPTTLNKIQNKWKKQSKLFCTFSEFEKLTNIKPLKVLKAFFLPHMKLRQYLKKFNFKFDDMVSDHCNELRDFMIKLKNYTEKQLVANMQEINNQDLITEASIGTDVIINNILKTIREKFPDDTELRNYEFEDGPNDEHFKVVNKMNANDDFFVLLENYSIIKKNYTRATYQGRNNHLLNKLNDTNISRKININFIKCILGNNFCGSENYNKTFLWENLYNFNQVLKMYFNAKKYVFQMLQANDNNKSQDNRKNILQNNCQIFSNCWRLFYESNLFVSYNSSSNYLWDKQVDRLKLIAKIFQNLSEDNYIPFKSFFGSHKVSFDYALKNGKAVEGKFLRSQIHPNDKELIDQIIGDDNDIIFTPFVQIILLYKCCHIYSLPMKARKRIIAVLTEMLTGPCDINQRHALRGLKSLIPDPTQFGSYFGSIDFGAIDLSKILGSSKDEHLVFGNHLLKLFLACTEGTKSIASQVKLHSDIWWSPQTVIDSGIMLLQKYITIKKSEKSASRDNKKESILHEEKNKTKHVFNTSSWIKNCLLHPDKLESLYKSSFDDPYIFVVISRIYQYLLQISENAEKFKIYLQEKQKQFNKIASSQLDPSTFSSKEIHQIFFIEFCRRITSSIEVKIKNEFIDNDNGELVKFIFLRHPISDYLSESTKKNFFNNVTIDTHESKIMDLFRNSDLFYKEMLAGRNRARLSNSLFRLLSRDMISRYAFCMFLDILLMNMMIIITFEWKSLSDSNYNELSGSNAINIFIIIVTIVNIVLSTIYMFGWVAELLEVGDANEQIKSIENSNQTTSLICRFYQMVTQFIITMKNVIFNSISTVFLFIIITSALYLITRIPIFIGIQLLTIFAFSKTLQSLLSTIAQNWIELLVTFVLGIFILYCYALVTTQRYKDDLLSQNTIYGSEDTYCYDVLGCFLHLLNIGIRKAGIGDALIYPSYRMRIDSNNYFGTFSVSMSSFILVNIIVLNVILAIITDSFGARRDTQGLRGNFLTGFKFCCQYPSDEDKKSRCFICNLKAVDFQKEGKSFESHISGLHYVWSYIDLHIYLKSSKEKDLLGTEIILWKAFLSGDYSIIPNEETLEIDGNKLEKDKRLLVIEEQLKTNLTIIAGKLEAQENQIKLIHNEVKDQIKAAENQLKGQIKEIANSMSVRTDELKSLLIAMIGSNQMIEVQSKQKNQNERELQEAAKNQSKIDGQIP